MAKNQQFKDSLKKFRRSLEETINERALRIGNRVSKSIAETFVHNAKARLMRDIEPLDANSRNLAQQIADSIHCEEDVRTLYSSGNTKVKKATGYVVRIPIDRQGLAMFLEYGTGLEGQNNPHPEARNFGWDYAINNGTIKQNYDRYHKIRQVEWYPTINGKTGFVFRKKNSSYITNGDIQFKNEYQKMIDKETSKEIFVPETPMHSKLGKAFTRRAYSYTITKIISEPVNVKSKNDYVISSGLKPVRYIYNTKQEIRTLLDNTKVYNVSFIRKLNKLKI